ncbi:hypothetical protein U9M48_013864 [Paspalum notatum var. saurae]|uniref:Uncharacterized protein n=1 Tax=Paspalum notatum var. saurae TaxID=547442 RepID=A0AAQ3T1B5_PASNO
MDLRNCGEDREGLGESLGPGGEQGKKITLLPLTPTEIVKCDRAIAETAERVYVFPAEIPPGLPPLRGIEHQIDLILDATLPNRAAYRTNPEGTNEIQRQVQEGFSTIAAPLNELTKKGVTFHWGSAWRRSDGSFWCDEDDGHLNPYLGEEYEIVSRTTSLQEGEDDEDITLMFMQGPITRARTMERIMKAWENHSNQEESKEGAQAKVEAKSNSISSSSRPPGIARTKFDA